MSLNKTGDKIITGKPYSKPKVTRLSLDNSISLVMMTTIPPDPPPRGGSKGGSVQPESDPWASPFSDKPFS